VSKYIEQRLPPILKSFMDEPDWTITDCLNKAVKNVDHDIELSRIDSYNSGSTC